MDRESKCNLSRLKFDRVAAHGGALTTADIDRPRNVSQPPPPTRITTPPWPSIPDIATLALNPPFPPPSSSSSFSSSSGVENSRADNFQDRIQGKLVKGKNLVEDRRNKDGITSFEGSSND